MIMSRMEMIKVCVTSRQCHEILYTRDTLKIIPAAEILFAQPSAGIIFNTPIFPSPQ